MKVTVVENVLKLNDEIAAINRETLLKAGVFTLDLIGAPGCGKTALLEATIPLLSSELRCAVVVGDLATQRDADRLAQFCPQVVQINTGKGCHLEAHHVRQAIAKLDLSSIDVLFIENVGNLICPVGFDLGQDVKVGMFAVSDGDDKAAKHPYLVSEADLLLLGKIDLLPHVPFDVELFLADVKHLKPTAEVIQLSAKNGVGMELWHQWVLRRYRARRGAAGGAFVK
ncbi:hydrogenase nickel incorporation protein HypB [Fontivita pretiosa]|uniref:hydrogenase nickel incorporation protein HypB n=1 Tax=Fontivita pretiosa TaxID=2989684 RepID=UPI003D174437